MKIKRNIIALICALCAMCLIVGACGDGEDPPTQPNSYVISFETNGGEPLQPVTWAEGAAITLPTPTREGYSFTGWYYDAALLQAADASKFSVDKDSTLYADWEYIPKTFTISFETNGGEPLQPVTWAEGTAFDVTPPTREQYAFAGWYYDIVLMHEVNVDDFSVDKDVTLYAAWDYAPTKYAIRLYTTEDEYTELMYKPGDTVDISQWQDPEPILFEGDGCPFLHWIDETYTDILEENFVMPKKSLAFYAEYDMPQMFNWAYDADAHTYTSTGTGIRPIKNAEDGYYGELSADFVMGDVATTAIGLIWNATVADIDKPYDYTTGSTYWYFHLNPTNGGFQIAKVVDTYTALHTIGINSTPAAWQTKFNAYKANMTPGFTFNMKVKFMPDKIELFIDGDLVYSYAGSELNTVLGSAVGLRVNRAGNVAKNIVWTPSDEYADVKKLNYVTDKDGIVVPSRLWATAVELPLPEIAQNGWESTGWYADAARETPASKDSVVEEQGEINVYAAWRAVAMRNGYKIYDDKYVYNTSGLAFIAVEGYNHEYGKWSVDFTATAANVGRIGLVIQGAFPDTDSAFSWSNEDMYGYLLYHNMGAYTSANITNFTYAKSDDFDKNGAAAKHGYQSINAYVSKTVIDSKNNNGYGALNDYHNRMLAFKAGETQSVTVRMGIAITPTRVALYADDVLLAAYKNLGKIARSGDRFGFFTEGNGEFTNWQYEQAEDANGFIVTTDAAGKKTYTSAPVNLTARHAVNVVGLTGRYGKWEAEMEISDTRSVGSGLIINTNMAIAAGADEVLYAPGAGKSDHNAYYLYNNQNVNANITLASVVNGLYTTGGTVKAYDASTAGALGDYYKRVNAFKSGETRKLKVKYAIEVTQTEINIYVDDEKIITNTEYGGKFDDIAECVGVGFVAYGCGAAFTNFVFTPAE